MAASQQWYKHERREISITEGCYLATDNEDTEDFMCAVVTAIFGMCKLVKGLWLLVITGYESSNQIINPNPMSGH
jgi:hypothetical protein